MSKKKNAELSRMWGFAGKRHWLTIASCILAGISTVLSIIPFVCIWFVIRDILYAMKKGDLSLAASSGHYAWLAVAFSLLSILLYFVALCCSHLAAFRTATNMKKEAMHHIVTLPLGYFSQNASGRLRKIIDDNAGLTEGFLAHQLPDLTGAVVMPVAVISLLFVFDWRLGICCLIPLAISVFFLKKMMGGDNADFMSGYMTNRIMISSEQLMEAKSSVIRIESILQEKPLKESNTQKQPKDASVVFEDVSFTYPGAKKKALYHVSFEVPDGKKIALVGASGSGKSTAASLIPRFYDVQEGDVLVGGVDVREIAKNDLMDQIAFVFQNTRLFNDTLLENIRASRPDATREEVMRAAEAAQCQDIIERLPNGLDTIVGSGGTYLSGGENQRIALARAILKDAPIIILDEATAFADAENEHQIQLAFEGLTSGKTVLMIAHRLSTIQDADMILVFGDGKIIERGNHDELLKQNGVYASMWKEYQTQIIWKVGTTVRKEENHD